MYIADFMRDHPQVEELTPLLYVATWVGLAFGLQLIGIPAYVGALSAAFLASALWFYTVRWLGSQAFLGSLLAVMVPAAVLLWPLIRT